MTKKSAKMKTPAFEKVTKEFARLVAGRENMDIKEVMELRSYAKERTDLKKPAKDLSDVEWAWKHYYKEMDKLVDESLEPETKKDLDRMQEQMESLDDLARQVEYVCSLGKDVEKLFIHQLVHIQLHCDNSEENAYKEKKEQMEKIMLSDAVPADKRKQAAEVVIQLADVYEDKFINDLKDTNSSIQKKLAAFERELKKLEAFDAEESEVIVKDSKEWLELANQTNLARVTATNSIIKQVKMDRYLPQRVIDGKASDETLPKEETDKLMEDMLSYAMMIKTASKEEEELSEKREPIAKRLFGDYEKEYIAEQGGGEEAPAETVQRVPSELEAKAWYRLAKVVYIGLWIVGGGFVALLGFASEDFGVFFVGMLIVWGILTAIRKAFLYVVLGK